MPMHRFYSQIKICLLLLFSVILLQSCGKNVNKHAIAEQSLQLITQKLTPDQRDQIFEVELDFKDLDTVHLVGSVENVAAVDSLKTALSQLGYSVKDELKRLPLARYASTKALVNISVANVKAEPSHRSELVTQFLMGHPVHILDEDGGWYRVRGMDNYPGWIEKMAVEVLDEQEVAQWNTSNKAMVMRDLRMQDEQGKTLFDLSKGNIVRLLEGKNKAANQAIALPNGVQGWVPQSQLQALDQWQREGISQLDAASILESAQTFLGTPYVWGGTSVRGVDCSGFTKSVFLEHGWMLQRDASQQVRAGIEVATDTTELAQLKPGDLVFFGRRATEDRKERVIHVGIWLGNGQMINASGYVKIESLIAGQPNYNARRAETFLRAKRYLGLEREAGFTWLTPADFNL